MKQKQYSAMRKYRKSLIQFTVNYEQLQLCYIRKERIFGKQLNDMSELLLILDEDEFAVLNQELKKKYKVLSKNIELYKDMVRNTAKVVVELAEKLNKLGFETKSEAFVIAKSFTNN